MPYSIEKRGDKHCVIKSDTGETKKCYPARAAAMAYLRALYAHVKDAR